MNTPAKSLLIATAALAGLLTGCATQPKACACGHCPSAKGAKGHCGTKANCSSKTTCRAHGNCGAKANCTTKGS